MTPLEQKQEKLKESEMKTNSKTVCTGCSVPLDLHGTCCGWENAKGNVLIPEFTAVKTSEIKKTKELLDWLNKRCPQKPPYETHELGINFVRELRNRLKNYDIAEKALSEIASLENQSEPEQIKVEIMRKANELVYPLAGDCTKSDAERKCIEMAKWMQSRLSLQAKETIKPSDQDIENAALDYVDEESNHFARQAKRAAYTQGAKDMRDNNIYVSPIETKRR